MSDTDTAKQKQFLNQGGGSLTSLLAALQQGVLAINNLTATLRTTFPST